MYEGVGAQHNRQKQRYRLHNEGCWYRVQATAVINCADGAEEKISPNLLGEGGGGWEGPGVGGWVVWDTGALPTPCGANMPTEQKKPTSTTNSRGATHLGDQITHQTEVNQTSAGNTPKRGGHALLTPALGLAKWFAAVQCDLVREYAIASPKR